MYLKNHNNYLIFLLTPIAILITLYIAVFLATHYSHSSSSYIQIQLKYFLLLNHWFAYLPDVVWHNLTYLGTWFILLPLILIFIKNNLQLIKAVCLSILIGSALAGLGKLLFGVPRPALALDATQFHIIGPMLKTFTSLPSGHSTTAFALLSPIIIHLIYSSSNQKLIAILLLFAIAIIVCISRIAVGAHWPLDTIAGAAVGFLSASLSYAIIAKYPMSVINSNRMMYILIALSLIIGLNIVIHSIITHAVLVIFVLAFFSCFCLAYYKIRQII